MLYVVIACPLPDSKKKKKNYLLSIIPKIFLKIGSVESLVLKISYDKGVLFIFSYPLVI